MYLWIVQLQCQISKDVSTSPPNSMEATELQRYNHEIEIDWSWNQSSRVFTSNFNIRSKNRYDCQNQKYSLIHIPAKVDHRHCDEVLRCLRMKYQLVNISGFDNHNFIYSSIIQQTWWTYSPINIRCYNKDWGFMHQ